MRIRCWLTSNLLKINRKTACFQSSTEEDKDCYGLASATECFRIVQPGDKLYRNTISQGRGSCPTRRRPGWPAGSGMLVVTSVTGPSKPCSIRSSTSITRRSLPIWLSRAGNDRVMCKGNLRSFSNAAGWNMVFYGGASSPAIPSTWLLSAANEEGSA